MGIMSRVAVKGMLKEGKGGLFLIGKMANGKSCVVNISDTSNGTRNVLGKEEFVNNLISLISKSSESAINKAKESNDMVKVASLEKDLKRRIKQIKDEGKEVKLLIEEATGIYSIKDERFAINANGTPKTTKSV